MGLKWWKFETDLGGGKELMAGVIITFIFGSRLHFFYYMSILALDKVFISYFKLAYHDPRPYMIQSTITPEKCSSGFGNPSGHSHASSLFAVALFLDVFHGAQIGKSIERFFSKTVYFFCLGLAIFWAASIPYSRFVMGVHSLDQIIFGSTLGLWSGLTMHFLVRDNLLKHIGSLMQSDEYASMSPPDSPK